jgi:glycosyltransferase involved in cell wall biosynthesis
MDCVELLSMKPGHGEQVASRRIRLLWLVHYPVFSGPHNRILRSARLLGECGIDVVAVLPDEPGDAAERLFGGGVEVVQIPLTRVRATRHPRDHLALAKRFSSEVGALRGLIRRQAADAIVVGGLINPHGALAGHLEGTAVIWQVIDTRTPRLARVALRPLVRRWADAVVFGGSALIEAHFPSGRVGRPHAVIRPAVDTSRFLPSKERAAAARRDLGVPAGAPLVGTVANLNPQKGVEYFVRAAALVHRSHPDAHFVVVGARYDTHREYASDIDREVAATAIPAAQFHFTGPRADVESLYPAMTVKLITSVPKSEGTTTTAMEAMACGVPVVACDVGAVAEVVDDGRSGLMVPPRDPAAIAEATGRLLDDATLREAFGARGRRSAVERLDVRASVDLQARTVRAAVAHRAGRRLRSAA